MSLRVQVILSLEERERLRRQATREGKSLSRWMREAANIVYAQRCNQTPMNAQEVHALFDSCRDLGGDVVADAWEDLKASIEQERPSTAAALAEESPR